MSPWFGQVISIAKEVGFGAAVVTMQLCCSDAALWQRAGGTALMSTAAVAVFGELEDAEILQSSCEACPCWVSLPDSSQRVYMVYNQDLSVRAGAVFSLSPAEQLPVTVQGETIVTLYPGPGTVPISRLAGQGWR